MCAQKPMSSQLDLMHVVKLGKYVAKKRNKKIQGGNKKSLTVLVLTLTQQVMSVISTVKQMLDFGRLTRYSSHNKNTVNNDIL